jgi:hypothetical protein
VEDSLNLLKSVISQTTNQATTTLSVTEFMQLASSVSLTDLKTFALANAQKACTTCAHAAYSVARTAFPSLAAAADADVSATCGASFIGASLRADAARDILMTLLNQTATRRRVSAPLFPTRPRALLPTAALLPLDVALTLLRWPCSLSPQRLHFSHEHVDSRH